MPKTDYRNINCQAYAFFRTKTDAEAFYPYDHTYEYINLEKNEALEKTKVEMKKWLNNTFTSSRWREVERFDATLSSNEWLVCMRVGVIKGSEYDYHFWYRADDGKWYNKHGWYLASECIEGVVNPSKADSSSGWSLDGYTNFYSSDTVYYAIKAN